MDKLPERLKADSLGIKDIDEKKGIVRAYINKFNVIDSYNELSLPGSFKKTFSERLKKTWWLLNHDWDKMLGVTLALEEDSVGAIATGRFNLKKQIGLDTFNDYLLFAEEGRTLQHSVRVRPVRYIIENDITRVSEWMMTEWSTLTQKAAIEDTPMLSIKSEIEQATKALELKYSDEKLKAFKDRINELEAQLKAAAESTDLKSPQPAKEIINFINNLKL